MTRARFGLQFGPRWPNISWSQMLETKWQRSQEATQTLPPASGLPEPLGQPLDPASITVKATTCAKREMVPDSHLHALGASTGLSANMPPNPSGSSLANCQATRDNATLPPTSLDIAMQPNSRRSACSPPPKSRLSGSHEGMSPRQTHCSLPPNATWTAQTPASYQGQGSTQQGSDAPSVTSPDPPAIEPASRPGAQEPSQPLPVQLRVLSSICQESTIAIKEEHSNTPDERQSVGSFISENNEARKRKFSPGLRSADDTAASVGGSAPISSHLATAAVTAAQAMSPGSHMCSSGLCAWALAIQENLANKFTGSWQLPQLPGASGHAILDVHGHVGEHFHGTNLKTLDQVLLPRGDGVLLPGKALDGYNRSTPGEGYAVKGKVRALSCSDNLSQAQRGYAGPCQIKEGLFAQIVCEVTAAPGVPPIQRNGTKSAWQCQALVVQRVHFWHPEGLRQQDFYQPAERFDWPAYQAFAGPNGERQGTGSFAPASFSCAALDFPGTHSAQSSTAPAPASSRPPCQAVATADTSAVPRPAVPQATNSGPAWHIRSWHDGIQPGLALCDSTSSPSLLCVACDICMPNQESSWQHHIQLQSHQRAADTMVPCSHCSDGLCHSDLQRCFRCHQPILSLPAWYALSTESSSGYALSTEWPLPLATALLAIRANACRDYTPTGVPLNPRDPFFLSDLQQEEIVRSDLHDHADMNRRIRLMRSVVYRLGTGQHTGAELEQKRALAHPGLDANKAVDLAHWLEDRLCRFLTLCCLPVPLTIKTWQSWHQAGGLVIWHRGASSKALVFPMSKLSTLAQIDFFRGSCSQDYQNTTWQDVYGRLGTLAAVLLQLGRVPPTSTKGIGNLMETIVGIAYAVASGGNHLPPENHIQVIPHHAKWMWQSIWWILQEHGMGPALTRPPSQEKELAWNVNDQGIILADAGRPLADLNASEIGHVQIWGSSSGSSSLQ